jgi:hypothetical protein
MRLVVEALAATGQEASAVRLLGAQHASVRAGVPYGADERRQRDLLASMEDRLGADTVAGLLDEGRALDDEAAIDEALAAVSRALGAA